MRKPTWITRWPWWAWAVAVVVVIGAVAVALLVADGDDGGTAVASDRSTTTSTSESTTTTSTTMSSTTTTAPPTTTTAPPPTTTTAPPAPVPVPVPAAITAQRGGGSGEVTVRWNAVPGATGYRVERRIDRGAFTTVADFDITTGATTADDSVVNIWSQGYSYRPVRNPFPGTDQSPWFEYVDVGNPAQRCYRVTAYNPSGNAPASNTACASPP